MCIRDRSTWGLGLSISQSLVIMLGGNGISVNSLPQQGTTFSFDLPLQSNKESLRVVVSGDSIDELKSDKKLNLKAPKFFSEINKITSQEEKCECRRALLVDDCLLYTSPSPRDRQKSRMPSSA
eukprot:TRINITY_DN13055_c0_g1_i1.p1 TRINITY_DN13055_c0_g1~~TRINITY_DN13055_c0_g1_i1.p1  ORF type:complete len:124 (-),score=23.47 TRINITY_DN13055_c0_g1_i1:29-400(-)